MAYDVSAGPGEEEPLDRVPWGAGRTAGRIVLGLTLAILCGPVLADLLASDKRQSFRYVAADSFYYLTVARNIADHGRVSFDHDHATNGFHPLWQLFLGAAYGIGRIFGVQDHSMVGVAVLLSLFLITVGVWFLAKAMSLERGRLSPLFMLMSVGVYGITVSSMWLSFSKEALAKQNLGEGSQPLYGTLWSYVNGMETGAVLCLYGLVAYWYVRHPYLERTRNAVVYGALLALLVFARLDHVFIVGVFALAAALHALLHRSRAVLRQTGIVLAALIVPLGIYVLINEIYFGSLIPLSGKLKSTFPFLSNDFIHLLKAMDRHVASGKWLALAWRLTQLLVPMGVALLYLPRAFRLRAATGGGVVVSVRYSEERFERFLALTAIGVLLLGLYNFLFVPHGHHGHWYFPVSTVFVTLAFVQTMSRWRWAQLLWHRWGLVACAVLCVAGSLFCFLRLHRTPDYHDRYISFFFDEAPRLRAYYKGRRPRLFSVDDGIVAFATGFPTMSGTGLNTDAKGFHYRKGNRLGELAVARGYNHFTSFIYTNINPCRLNVSTSSRRIGLWARRGYQIRHPERYHFSIDYRSKTGRVAVIKVTPTASHKQRSRPTPSASRTAKKSGP